MAKVGKCGLMEQFIMVSGREIELRGRANSRIMRKTSTMEISSGIKQRGLGSIPSRMG